MSNKKFNLLRFLRQNYIIFLLLFIGSYIFYFRNFFEVDVFLKSPDIFIALLCFGIVMSDVYTYKLKYLSYTLTMPSLHFSIGEPPFPFTFAGVNFYAFRLDGFAAELMHWKGDKGVAVIPQSYVFNQGGNYVSTALPVPVDVEELPVPAKSFIEFNKLPEPYFLCLVPSYLAGLDEIKTPKAKDVIEEYQTIIENMDRLINKQDRLLSGDWETMDTITQKVANYNQSMNRQPSFMERLRGDKK